MSHRVLPGYLGSICSWSSGFSGMVEEAIWSRWLQDTGVALNGHKSFSCTEDALKPVPVRLPLGCLCCCSKEGPFLEGNSSASLLAAWRRSAVLSHPPASPAAPKKGLARGEEREPWHSLISEILKHLWPPQGLVTPVWSVALSLFDGTAAGRLGSLLHPKTPRVHELVR